MLKWVLCVTVIVKLNPMEWKPTGVEVKIIERYTVKCTNSSVAEKCELKVDKHLREDGGYHYNIICKKEERRGRI